MHLKQKHSDVGKITLTLVGVLHLQFIFVLLVLIYRSMCTSDNVSPHVTTSKHCRSTIKSPRKKEKARNVVPELFYMQMLSW
jgi:hypothetical protein